MTSLRNPMSSNLVARVAWTVPAVLLLLSVHQIVTAVNLGRTLDEGEQAMAEVTRYERSDRKDVTHVELDLLVRMQDGTTLERTRMALPYSIGHRVEAESLNVTVLPGSGQEVVITQIGRTQARIAWSNGAMSFLAFLMALVAFSAGIAGCPGRSGKQLENHPDWALVDSDPFVYCPNRWGCPCG